ncbi:MAG: hypothetical protein ACJ0DI_06980 [bacterium]
MSEANISHLLFWPLGRFRRLGFLVLVLVLHFVLIACDSTPVEEESESLQQTKTAKPGDPVVMNTDDQVPPTLELTFGASNPTGIVMDVSPVVNFTPSEKGTVYITGKDGGNCPAKIFETEVSANVNNCVELRSSRSTAQSILDLEGGSYDCRLVVIDQGGNQGYNDSLSFTIVSPTSQAGDLLNQLQDNMSGTTSTVDSTCSSTSSRMSSSRTALSSDENSCVGCEMSSKDSSKVLVKVAEALRHQGLLNSSNLLDLMPKIVELVQKNLKEASTLTNDNKTIVIQNMLGTLISSMKGREVFMPPSSAEPGLSVQTTLLKNITKSSVSNLAAAFETNNTSGRSAASSHNRSGSDLAKDTGNLIDAIVGGGGGGGGVQWGRVVWMPLKWDLL